MSRAYPTADQMYWGEVTGAWLIGFITGVWGFYDYASRQG